VWCYGGEFIAHSVQRWLAVARIETAYIAPGSPWENAYVESFNGKLRDNLNQSLSYPLVGRADGQRQARPHSRGTQAGCWQVQWNRLAYVPPHVPFVAERDRSADEGAAGTDAARLHPDDDERLWTGDGVIEERSEWKDRRDGAQAGSGERLNAGFSYWEFLGVCRSDQIFVSC